MKAFTPVLLIFTMLLAWLAVSCGGESHGVGDADQEVDSEVIEDGQDLPSDQPTDLPSDLPVDQPADTPCGPGETLCGSECVDTQSDPNNCGDCYVICGTDQVCSNGECADECAPGLTDCHGACVDTSSDEENCGNCDVVCPEELNADPVCEDGECGYQCRPGWSDLDGEPGCEAECEVTSDVEICNGLDDECDGLVDEDFDCIMNQETDCTTTCGSTGTGTCGADCTLPTADACTPPAETCNGVDDDCDGTADNGFDCAAGSSVDCTTTCGSTGTGLCGADCTLPTADACTPPAETCNGEDDDCDGSSDEDLACEAGASEACTTSCDSSGTRTCSDSCTWGSCTPPAETCNGEDDDCDGSADEDFACAAGASEACTTSCDSTGTRTCSDSCTWGSCTPPAETCNGEDDDCDGTADEDFACMAGSSQACTSSCGTAGTQTCSSTCTWGACTPPDEVCNGADDDCDGTCDNGFDCCAGSSGTCATSCGSTGTRLCSNTCAWGACTPPDEVCNGADDDCDGTCDNGFPCCAGTSRSCTSGLCGGTETCSGACDWGACDLGPAPANDTCAGAVDVSAGGTFAGTTCAAGHDYEASCASSTSPDVVYVLALEHRSNVDLTTCNASTDFDTILSVRTSCIDSTTEIACNDDTLSSICGLQSTITTTLDPGTYYIIVDGYMSTNSGPFALDVSITPVNDTCATALPLASSGTITGSTTFATDDTEACAGDGTRGLWYVFRLAQREVVYFDTFGTSWDTVLTLRSGLCPGTLQQCEDDNCSTAQDQLVADLAPGTYYLLVSGYFSTSHGSFTLNFSRSPCPGVTALPSSEVWFTIGAGDDTQGTCHLEGAPDVPYYFTLCPGNNDVSLTTCSATTDFDTTLYIRTGGGGVCGSTEVACNDDDAFCASSSLHSTLATSVAGPGLFFAVVDGFVSGEDGVYELTASW